MITGRRLEAERNTAADLAAAAQDKADHYHNAAGIAQNDADNAGANHQARAHHLKAVEKNDRRASKYHQEAMAHSQKSTGLSTSAHEHFAHAAGVYDL